MEQFLSILIAVIAAGGVTGIITYFTTRSTNNSNADRDRMVNELENKKLDVDIWEKQVQLLQGSLDKAYARADVTEEEIEELKAQKRALEEKIQGLTSRVYELEHELRRMSNALREQGLDVE